MGNHKPLIFLGGVRLTSHEKIPRCFFYTTSKTPTKNSSEGTEQFAAFERGFIGKESPWPTFHVCKWKSLKLYPFVIFAPTTWGVPFLVFKKLSPEKKKKNFQRPQKLVFSPPHHWLEVLLREYRRVRLEKLSETLGKVQDLPLGWRIELVVATQVGWIFRPNFSPTKLNRPWKIGLENQSWVASPILLLIQLLGEMKKGMGRWEVATDFFGVELPLPSKGRLENWWSFRILEGGDDSCKSQKKSTNVGVAMIDLFPCFPWLEKWLEMIN